MTLPPPSSQNRSISEWRDFLCMRSLLTETRAHKRKESRVTWEKASSANSARDPRPSVFIGLVNVLGLSTDSKIIDAKWLDFVKLPFSKSHWPGWCKRIPHQRHRPYYGDERSQWPTQTGDRKSMIRNQERPGMGQTIKEFDTSKWFFKPKIHSSVFKILSLIETC